MARVSVIVPVYKVEHELRRCVDSILAQTFRDFALVLVDDGSPDACGAICDDYARTDDRVSVIHQENRGLSAARNAGIDWTMRRPDCDWLTFVDSDDWVNSAYLESMLAMDDGRVKILLANVAQDDGRRSKWLEPAESGLFSGEDLCARRDIQHIVAWGKLFRRELLEKLRFREGVIHEDEFFTYRLFYTSGRLAYAVLAHYHYVQRPESIVGRKWNPGRLVGCEGIREQLEFFARHDLEVARLFTERRLLETLSLALRGLRRDCPGGRACIDAVRRELVERCRKFALAMGGDAHVRCAVRSALHPCLIPFWKLQYAFNLLAEKGWRACWKKAVGKVVR